MSEFSETRAGLRQIRASAGEFVTETFDYDDGRPVTVYVPPDPPEAIVFAGDGQTISQWGRSLEAADVPPTMIVGVHSAASEKLRLHEYSPKFDAARWAAALRDAKAEVVMRERGGGHDAALWRREFPLMIQWAFGRSPDPA